MRNEFFLIILLNIRKIKNIIKKEKLKKNSITQSNPIVLH